MRKFRNENGQKFFDESQIWDNTFHRKVKPSHFFKKYEAWALAEETIQALNELGVTHVELESKADKTVYRATVQTFMKRGVRDNFGAGWQYFLYVCPANYERLPIGK